MQTFKLPDLGEGLPDAEIVNWLVKEGDTVTQDQPMVEMETAKAVVEVPAPFSGVIAKFYGQAGDIIKTGDALVDINTSGKVSETPKATVATQTEQTQPVAKPAAINSGSESAKVFHLPDLGEGLPDAEIVNWLVNEGDTVKTDQPMVEMETAKAVVEVPSPFDGVITQFHGQPGDIIKTGAALVSFGGVATDTNALEADAEEQREDSGTVVGKIESSNVVSTERTTSVAGSKNKITPVIKALARKLKVNLDVVTATGKDNLVTQADVKKAAQDGNTATTAATSNAPLPVASNTQSPLSFKASPAVRALAGRLGVNLADCKASGRKGSITRDDVSAASKKPATSTVSSMTQLNVPARPVAPTVNISGKPEPVRGARRAMAQAMAASHANVVPVTLMDDASISHWPKGTDATARMLRALAYACKVEPALNASFDGESMEKTLHPQVHVGIAVDTPAGLYVPVIKHADSTAGPQLREELNRLISSIADKSIKPSELMGGTISLSNFGTIAGRYGTPVVTLPQVAILGTGRYRDELKLTDIGISKQRMLPLSLSFDHRACTGGEGARFLAAVIEDLQSGE
jgi:pyruvate dehydrogenase E2 component (dihydrolipoamide acetyltransferase)